MCRRSRERELLGLWLVISPCRFSNDEETIGRRRLMYGACTVRFAVHEYNYIFYTDSVFSPCPPTRPPLRRIDLILMLWPICFVAATRQGPHLKPREFGKSVEAVAGVTVSGVTGFVGVTASRQGPPISAMTCGDQCGKPAHSTERQIEHPYWETIPPNTHRGQQLVSVCRC